VGRPSAIHVSSLSLQHPGYVVMKNIYGDPGLATALFSQHFSCPMRLWKELLLNIPRKTVNFTAIWQYKTR